MSPMIGFTLQERHFARGVEDLQASLAEIEATGIDFVSVLDHLTFWDGAGFDGLANAAAVAAAHPRIPISITVLLLPVRHPVIVARHLSSIALLAPGRLTLGVGVGGEDRHEIEAAGIDPHTRGSRMNESLTVLRALLEEGEVTFTGEHFDLRSVRVHPSPTSPIPILIGGRSDAALRRTARLGDGWLAFACSPERFAAATVAIQAEAELHGRGDFPFDNGLVVWCGYSEHSSGPSALAAEMESLYKIPFDRFAKYCFEGSPGEVAKQLALYADAGCGRFSIIPVGDSLEHEINCVSETGRELRRLMQDGETPVPGA
jgi:alkanesulfonate monooxygenase SsuD/methylene tetrahydromethanopterin reductase-like flavin-dependent oxidoreductase (luciferase family)